MVLRSAMRQGVMQVVQINIIIIQMNDKVFGILLQSLFASRRDREHSECVGIGSVAVGMVGI